MNLWTLLGVPNPPFNNSRISMAFSSGLLPATWGFFFSMALLNGEDINPAASGDVSANGKFPGGLGPGLDSTKPLGIMFFLGLMDSANGKLVVWDPVVWIPGIPLMKGIVT